MIASCVTVNLQILTMGGFLSMECSDSVTWLIPELVFTCQSLRRDRLAVFCPVTCSFRDFFFCYTYSGISLLLHSFGDFSLATLIRGFFFCYTHSGISLFYTHSGICLSLHLFGDLSLATLIRGFLFCYTHSGVFLLLHALSIFCKIVVSDR